MKSMKISPVSDEKLEEIRLECESYYYIPPNKAKFGECYLNEWASYIASIYAFRSHHCVFVDPVTLKRVCSYLMGKKISPCT